ncbi:MAG TPA: serine/threonine-protein kinase [Polyangiaceae bacterium]|jgi:serine/threonine-protein kinase|nr:serine/threonine-protein kinase [Polyangiaceae bacterium]
MELTGASFGVFEVWGRISEGGMSRVWLARHRELSIPVIIKTLRDSSGPGGLGTEPGSSRRSPSATTSDAYTRLRNEARLMARIPSPRIVRAVDLGVHEGCPYLAQEYVDGLDLAELDARRRTALGRGMPLWFVCHLVREVGDALHSAHQTGVLHRDVKPSNLFGAPQTGIRLGDFGIATTRDPRHATQSGTLRFLAPEALRGHSPARGWDIYSLGATAFDLFYGRPPFTELGDILGDAPVKFPQATLAQEAYFQHVLARMLDRNPDRRFHSITLPMKLLGSLASALRPSLHAVPIGRGAYQLGPVRVVCTMGDIAKAEVDGIVNSAHDEMQMRTGVGDALRKKGGQIIEDEAMAGGRRALGECIATSAGALASRYVLHAVSAWREVSCIARTVQRALLTAEELGLRSLAIPALGTGASRVVPEASAYAAASALHQHVLLGGSRLREVRFVLYDRETLDLFIEALNGTFLADADYLDMGGLLGTRAVEAGLDQTVNLDELRRLE